MSGRMTSQRRKHQKPRVIGHLISGTVPAAFTKPDDVNKQDDDEKGPTAVTFSEDTGND